ncbi:MAG: isoleucine--tRNA ligase [Candidatus Pacebacteria bacterium]|nr:isoleucine--tRNA ligase [Candidatus Paceibacterota bacterium]MBT4652093.1 isoleucine--tRNA ligase [Candidatus Paceibacterota bacterium]MBT6756115.1 isoleucine--tRNA ligase [Candidatus Paceibacterota bacterium]MBT6921708.1 isoleucine--tRNA ligase [Candidatus Paceibacterota bacterium]
MKKTYNFNQTPNLPELEEEVLQFWEKEDTFQKSIDMRDKENSYVFFDGPPFATGLPHYGHIVASTMKDIVPRYWTMKGKRVERKWGWDCHGLPIENIAEKELGIKRKNEIEDLGVEKFNEVCRSKVLSYVDDWKKIIKRLGRWADMDNDYKTMDLGFMESVWWVFKQLYDNGLVYEDYRSMHICPRCETTLSQSEVAEGYKDVKDISVTAEFEIKDFSKFYDGSEKIFFLAWTTTPWTLPGNFLLAVGPDIQYVLVSGEEKGNLYLLAETRVKEVFGEGKYAVVKKFTGKELKNLNYVPLFPYYKDTENAFRVVTADFVDTEEGTGIVHIAPGFGDDDFKIGQKENVELIQHVGMDGRFTEAVTDFAGMEVKPKEDPQSTDVEMIRYLAKKDLLFSKKKLSHSYPHCWRCDTPLLNYATGSWFVSVSKIKDRLLELAKDINWSPDHIKQGRWGKWLEGARDWSISRQRYWASVIPIWKCECGEMKVYGSVEELEKDSGQKVTDLHKHVVDKVTIDCSCGKEMNRIPDVLDTWFDSGSMPYGQAHYPFENKQDFEDNFPAEFIGEGLDQTRAWFYYLHVIAGGIKDSNAFKNVIVNGIVLAEDGKKMSKRLMNYPDPTLLINNYGSDSLRVYLASSPVLKAENLNFNEKEVADVRRKVFVIWWNILGFYTSFADEISVEKPVEKPTHILDQWVLSRMETVIEQVSQYMDDYDVVRASRMLMDFVGELSNWYLRLSRERLKSDDNSEISQVFGYVLYTLAQLFAPFAPFFTELVHKTLVDEDTSVHHSDWPDFDSAFQNEQLEEQMSLVQKVVELGHSARKGKGMKVRQPLPKATIRFSKEVLHTQMFEDYSSLLMLELNVKQVIWEKTDQEQTSVEMDWQLTPELEEEGSAREIMRTIQDLRRKAGLSIDDAAEVTLVSWPEKWQTEIEKKTSTKLVKGDEVKLSVK